jgi:copper resistance protein B
VSGRRIVAALVMVVTLVPQTARAQSPHPGEAEHVVHDRAIRAFVLVDQLEWLAGRDQSAGWDAKGWIGRDVDRFWFRTEGEAGADRLNRTETHLFYGRAISPWWELVAGVRADDGPGPMRTWAAVGVQGLAPYWFEVEATGYVGAAGRTHARLEVKYELLVTNRAILQPLIEVEIYGKDDPERQIGAGLSSADIGVRVRYEVKRELAAYLGVLWSRTFFGTADLARASGQEPNHTRLVAGVRFWR